MLDLMASKIEADIDKSEYALVYTGGNHIVSLECDSPYIDREWEAVGCEPMLDDTDFENFPKGDGLWIIRGVAAWYPGGWEHPEDGDSAFRVLEARRPSAEELEKIASGGSIFAHRNRCEKCGRVLVAGREMVIVTGCQNTSIYQPAECDEIEAHYCSECYAAQAGEEQP